MRVHTHTHGEFVNILQVCRLSLTPPRYSMQEHLGRLGQLILEGFYNIQSYRKLQRSIALSRLM